MVALWMIGFEDEPQRSAEICVCEIFGDEAGPDRALVGMGVHPFNDPEIDDDFEKLEAAIDIREWHNYSAIWTPDDRGHSPSDQTCTEPSRRPAANAVPSRAQRTVVASSPVGGASSTTSSPLTRSQTRTEPSS